MRAFFLVLVFAVFGCGGGNTTRNAVLRAQSSVVAPLTPAPGAIEFASIRYSPRAASLVAALETKVQGLPESIVVPVSARSSRAADIEQRSVWRS